MRIFIIFMLALVVCTSHDVYAQGGCIPVVSVYGKDICESDILLSDAIEKNLRASAKETGESASRAIEELKNAYLFRLVWEKSLVHKFDKKLFKPSKKEIRDYLKSYYRSSKKQYKSDRGLVKLISDLLRKNQYSPQDEQVLKSLLSRAEISVEAYRMKLRIEGKAKSELGDRERDIAAKAIRNWKIKKTLRGEYGGQIILQKAGLEPIDAYGAFLKELQSDDNVVIHDDEFKDIFEKMEEYIARDHIVIEEGSKNIKNYFSSPSWAYDKNIFQKAAEALKNNIKSLEPLGPKIIPKPTSKPEEELNDTQKVEDEMKKQISQSQRLNE